MNDTLRYGTACSFAVFAALIPLSALAQTASSTSLDGAGTTRVERAQLHGWRQSNEFQQAISALPAVAAPTLPIPVLFGVVPANLTPNFGDPRDGGARTHEGEDIMAVKGTPVVSPTEAVVLRTATGAGEGNAVYTANPGGETFVYMHLDRFGEGISSGTVLHPGSLIGYVGNTGNASGGAAHLHFEIHDSSGNPTNPFPRLTTEFTSADKLSYLSAIFGITSDPIALSQFLASNFRSTFTQDVQAGLILPPLITGALGIAPVTTTPGNTSSVIARNLYYGVSGEDVRALQQFLNVHGFTVASVGAGSFGNETTYFGPATRAAVIRFQIARSILPSVGYVGPLTRAALAA